MRLDANAAGVIIAGLGALLAYLVARRAADIAQVQADVALAQTKLNGEQTQLAAGALAGEWLSEFRAWTSEAIDTLSESVYECPPVASALTDAQDACIRRCRFRLSALIDRGRLFLPNLAQPGIGDDKPEAYRGLRHRVLDPLVAAEQVLAGTADISQFTDRRAALDHARREYVSRVQAILQPGAQNQQLAVLLERSRSSSGDPTIGGLIPAPGAIPEGAHAVLTP